jgi:hypothetical protein
MKVDVSGCYEWFVSNRKGSRSIITRMFADKINTSSFLRFKQLVPAVLKRQTQFGSVYWLAYHTIGACLHIRRVGAAVRSTFILRSSSVDVLVSLTEILRGLPQFS